MRHHVRASFYHIVALTFLFSNLLWWLGAIDDRFNMMVGIALFVTDYIAEMYDPHPTNPGPWFRRHFHRFLDD